MIYPQLLQEPPSLQTPCQLHLHLHSPVPQVQTVHLVCIFRSVLLCLTRRWGEQWEGHRQKKVWEMVGVPWHGCEWGYGVWVFLPGKNRIILEQVWEGLFIWCGQRSDMGLLFPFSVTACGPRLGLFTLNFTITNLLYREDMDHPGSGIFNYTERMLQHVVRLHRPCPSLLLHHKLVLCGCWKAGYSFPFLFPWQLRPLFKESSIGSSYAGCKMIALRWDLRLKSRALISSLLIPQVQG